MLITKPKVSLKQLDPQQHWPKPNTKSFKLQIPSEHILQLGSHSVFCFSVSQPVRHNKKLRMHYFTSRMWWWAAQQNHSLTFTHWHRASSVCLEVFQVWKLQKRAVSKTSPQVRGWYIWSLNTWKPCYEQMTVFLIALFCLLLTLIQGHSLWSLKQSAAGGETLTTGWHFIIELTQINTPHTHTAPNHPCPIFLKPDPDKYSSCKLQGAKVQPHTVCVRRQCKPPTNCRTLINKLYTATPSSLSIPL